jgi:hypothetical protein
MMERLSAKSLSEEEASDPLTLAGFIAKADNFHGAFDTTIALPAQPADVDFVWWLFPSNSVFTNPAGVLELSDKFWNPGQSIIPPSSDPAGTFQLSPMRGWAFLPERIILQFFTSASARKAAHVHRIWSHAAQHQTPGVAAATLNDTRKLLLLSRFISNGTREIQIYSATPGAFNVSTADESVQPLFPFPHIPGQRITFSERDGTAEGDLMRVTMTGRWIFSPRYIAPEDEARR